MKKIIKKILRSNGFVMHRVGKKNVSYLSEDLQRRIKLIRHFQIDTIFDVGANDGGYALEVRDSGFDGKIISFEPLVDAYIDLQEISKKDINWVVLNLALGDFDGESEINVAGNSKSSSLLEMMELHEVHAPSSVFIGKQPINIVRLDSLFKQYTKSISNVLLKIDTQGFEKNVLIGALESLDRIMMIQIEMSIVPLYKNSFDLIETINFLYERGFCLVSVETGFNDEVSGRTFQLDGLFVKSNLLNSNPS
jgi:FkbM family methyltransferase